MGKEDLWKVTVGISPMSDCHWDSTVFMTRIPCRTLKSGWWCLFGELIVVLASVISQLQAINVLFNLGY